MKKFIKSRKIQNGSVALILTVLVIVAVIIVNIIVATLAGRYDWLFADMNSNLVYDISDNCQKYLSDYVFSEVDKTNLVLTSAGEEPLKLEIIFCDDKDNITQDQSLKYIHDSIYEINGLFPNYLVIDYLNIWEKPSLARSYGVTATTDVICKFGDRFETMNLADFYVYEASDYSTPIAYNGEKIIASCLMRVTQEETPMCYLTSNHGEAFGDYELMRAVVESGYTVSFLDLSSDDIPEDCDLLVTYAPKQDLIIADSISSMSEIDKINAYMNAGGKYMVFLSSDTFVSGAHTNLEGFLSNWGIKYMHEPGEEGVENCYLIKDPAHSLTIDGYTVLSENAKTGLGAEIMKDLPKTNVFGNSTCISFETDFTADGNGNFVGTKNGKQRVASPLMVSHGSAEAWTAGRAVARANTDPFVLMAVSMQTCDNGERSFLLASASTDFASEEAMQSAVLGNSRTLTGIIRYMGKENAPVDLVFKPFGNTDIESLTTSTANTITVILAVIPTLACLVIGTVVLIRRKNR